MKTVLSLLSALMLVLPGFSQQTANKLPVAMAWEDQNINSSTLVMNAWGSFDPDGTIVKYEWKKIAGPVASDMQYADRATPILSNLVTGTYTFQLTVTDDKGATGTDLVNIKVNLPVRNQVPIANAGNDLTIHSSAILLDGTGSHDADGKIVAYSWNKISGPSSFNISDATTATPSISNLVNGTYSFELSVTDNDGVVSKTVVNITVSINPALNNNLAPVAFAGYDVQIAGSQTVLNSWGSFDPEGKPMTYLWRKTKGPSCKLLQQDASTPSITELVDGTYTFGVTVTDAEGAVSRDEVNVIVFSSNVENATFSSARKDIEAVTHAGKSAITIYPNPVADILNSKWNDEYTGYVSVALIDASGKAVKLLEVRKDQFDYNGQINVSQLKPGMYYLTIKTQNGRSVTKEFLKK